MCKKCQYCLESCYWYLIEERFCYDTNIALYEEPHKTDENRLIDNNVFYDKVALIAGRSIVTIDPLPKAPIDRQPVRRRVAWWSGDVEQQNKRNEEIQTEQTENYLNERKLQEDIRAVRTISGDLSQKKDSHLIANLHHPDVMKEQAAEEDRQPLAEGKSPISEPVTIRNRLRSLHERRVSRSLTLNLDNLDRNTLELPVIRQVSMPRFYLDTPEENQKEASMGTTPSTVLISPAIPRSQQLFDLRSVVQIEREQRVQSLHNSNSLCVQPSSTRLATIREKLKPLKIKRQASTPSLPGSVQYM